MSSDEEEHERSHSEEEEEEEVSEEEEEEEDSRKRKAKHSQDKRKTKKKKSLVNQFIEDEADDDDDDDEEVDELFGDERQEAEAVERMQRENEELSSSRRAFEDKSAEDIVNDIKKRHKRSQRRFDDEDLEGEIAHSEVTQQSLLPSVGDPKLWVFKCKPGREQHLVVAMMNKFIDFVDKGQPLRIKSVIASGAKGFVYVEAEREPHAKAAINGIRDIQPWSMKLVPVHEMTSVMSIKSRRKPIVAGSWARMKRAGLYKGDLCKVLEVFDSGTRAMVKLIPRLDVVALSGGEPTKYAKGQRPPQKLLQPGMIHGEITRRRHPATGEMLDFFDGDSFKEGFLLRELNIQTMLITEDVVPSIDEMQKFSQGTDDDPDEVATQGSTPWNRSVELAKGDTIRVIEGDLTNLMGVVVGTNPGTDTVKVMPLHEEIKDTILDFQTKQLMKYVKIGDHVKVISGRYSGETGTVVSIDEPGGVPIAIILADTMAKEIQVRVSNLQESSEISKGLDSLKGKELYDLISLPHGDVGVITHVGRDGFKVILQNGNTRDVTDQEIQRKLQSSRSAALDKNKNHISPGEMVSVVDGKFSGQSGTIKHLYRSFVFLHNNKISNNSGIFVVKSRQVVIAGNRTTTAPVTRRPMAPRQQESELVGKTVKIKKGLWKGYLGMVVEDSERKVKVEIHSKSKKVDVDKQNIIIAGTRRGQIRDNLRTSATPMGATPLPSATPLHSGSMTPMRTPLHQSATPTPNTPSGDAWNPAVNPGIDNQEQDMSYGSSFGTPLEPITPAAPTAATPGSGFYHPTTPGGLSYSPAPEAGGPSTPGMGYNPTTPAAATPAAFTPQTPNTPSGIGGMPLAPLTPATMESPLPSTPYGGGAPDSMNTSSSSVAVASWASPDIVVRVTSSGPYAEMVGTIRSIQNGVCVVDTGDQTLRIGTDGLTPVVPEKHDRVKVLSGDEAGQTGSLIGTDGGDGIVKMDGTLEINIYVLSSLAKISQ